MDQLLREGYWGLELMTFFPIKICRLSRMVWNIHYVWQRCSESRHFIGKSKVILALELRNPCLLSVLYEMRCTSRGRQQSDRDIAEAWAALSMSYAYLPLYLPNFQKW